MERLEPYVTTYALRKLLALPLVILGVSALIFFAVRVLPGDPARLMAGPKAPQSVVEAMRVKLGLDRPIWVQYETFLWRAVHGNLGTSISSHKPVVHEIAERFPYTLRLTVAAYVFAVLTGITAGVFAAIYQNTWFDNIAMFLAIVGASTANFWLALMAMNIFAVHLGWLPLLGAGGWKHYIMPMFTLGLFPAALVARMTRSSMLEVINQDYIRTALSKGLRPVIVYQKHALRNAMIPIVTVVGLNLGALLGGAVVTETVFNWPGLGRLLVNAVGVRDYPVIQGLTLLTVTTVVLTNFFVDLVIAFINPRIRYN